MLPRLRASATLVLLALLPWHALLVTVGTRLLRGANHAPWSVLALWKEALLAAILGMAVLELLATPSRIRPLDRLDACVLALAALAAAVTAWLGTPPALVFLGIKYDLVAPVAFLLLRRVPWPADFGARALRWLRATAFLVAGYGLLTFVLPQAFFGLLGYSTEFHSLYVPDSPLPAYHQIGETMLRRIQGGMSGPNQLGLWLLLPWSIALSAIVGRKGKKTDWLLLGLTGLALLLSFSRSAWIAAAAIAVVITWVRLPAKTARRLFLAGGAAAVCVLVVVALLLPQVVVRLSSSRGHLVRPIEAATLMIAHPLGSGLGSAGPASNRYSDPCVMLRPQDDPSWAKSTPDLCVFLGSTQVQPTTRACDCPVHPENWYLQLGVELGVAGLVLFTVLTVLLLLALSRAAKIDESVARPVSLAVLGIAIACLALHAWEDAAIAYTLWTLAAATLPVTRDSRG